MSFTHKLLSSELKEEQFKKRIKTLEVNFHNLIKLLILHSGVIVGYLNVFFLKQIDTWFKYRYQNIQAMSKYSNLIFYCFKINFTKFFIRKG